jgi:hypothetical protein
MRMFFVNNMDFEILNLVYQVCLFVYHLTCEFIVYYCFDFLQWYPYHNFECVEFVFF